MASYRETPHTLLVTLRCGLEQVRAAHVSVSYSSVSVLRAALRV